MENARLAGSLKKSQKEQKVRRMSARDRRQRILDAALHVFARENYQGATTAKIAEAAGITEPVIYQHFKSKRELFLEVIRINRKKMIEWNAEVLNAHDDPIKRYQAYTDMFMYYTTQTNRDVAMVWSMAFHVNDPELKEELRQTEDELLRQLTDDLRRSMEEGKIGSRHAPEVLSTLIFCLHGHLTWLTHVGAVHFRDWVYEDIKRCVEHLLSNEQPDAPVPPASPIWKSE
jgi:AcrR family transcriptional regulator